MAGCSYNGSWQGAVRRSLVTLKALTYAPTGGIVAAATTSLPEQLGGVRNWDYRFCWLRDATFTLLRAARLGGFDEEAKAWREWLLRAVAGDPSQLQIMYGVAGERRLTEFELPGCPATRARRPVRIGNAAVDQFQLDVYGEVMDALHLARRAGPAGRRRVWHLQLQADRTSWRTAGASPTRASGRSAARAGTSRIRRSWPGSPPTVRSGGRASPACRDRPTVARAARRDPQAGLRQGLRRRARHVHPVLRLAGARRVAC